MPKIHLITVAEFDQMTKARVYCAADRIQLIDGQLFDVPLQGALHAGTIARLHHRFVAAFERLAQVRSQASINLGIYSQPQPDIAVVRWDERFYYDQHPTAEDVHTVIEIGVGGALPFDREVKAHMYATWGILEFWIIDIEGGAIEIYRGPQNHGYKSKALFQRGQRVMVEAFPDVVFTVNELFD